MKNEMIKALDEHKLVLILRGIPDEKLIPVVQALYDGGIRFVEITYRPDGAVSDEHTAANIKRLAEHFAGKMYIGAGTVLKPELVQLTREAGGQFIVSPDADPAVIRETVRCGLMSIPGALTPTEIKAAHDNGADFVKLFPAKIMGTEYVKQIVAPLPHIKLLAVGGIDESNIGEYLKAGCRGFALGAGIASKDLVAAGNYAAITENVKRYIAALNA